MRTSRITTLAAVLMLSASGSAFAPAKAQADDGDHSANQRVRRDPIEKLARPRPEALRSVDRRLMPGQMNSMGQQAPSLTLPAPDNPAGAGHRRE